MYANIIIEKTNNIRGKPVDLDIDNISLWTNYTCLTGIFDCHGVLLEESV